MWKTIVIALVGIVLGASIALAGPRAHVDIAIHDFGAAIEGQPLAHDFVIKNTGDEVLEIFDLKST